MRKPTLTAAAAIAALTAAGVVAAAPPSLTLKAAPTLVAYGQTSTLSGTLSTGKSGQTVTVEGQECGKTVFTKVATVTTGANGAYTYAGKPTVNTSYRSRAKNATSPTVVVDVHPSLRLRKLAVRKFSVQLTAAQSFVGQFVYFQRYTATRKWRNVRKVTLTIVKAGTAPTAVSSAVFTGKVKSRVKVRVLLPKPNTGSCYLPALSNTTRS